MKTALKEEKSPNEQADVEMTKEELPKDLQQKSQQMGQAVKKNLSGQLLSMMNSCVHCGVCAEACHYCVSTGDLDLMPAVKLEKMSEILRKHFPRSRSPFSFAKDRILADEEITELFEAAFENCTLCGKCAMTCPMGINTGEIMYLARAMLCSIERLPEGLISPVKTALEMGNYVGISTQDFIETIEWVQEEMEDEMGEGFSVPIDKKGAEILYIPHPLEIRDYLFLLMYPVKIMHAAGENYTFSSYDYDTVNYAYHQGNKDSMARIAQRVLDAREKLDAQSIALAPCGHGYKSLRWDAEKYFGKRHPFPVLSIVELMDRYVHTGRIQIEKDTIEGPITYHDPCNIARCGGIIQPPRNVLNALTSQFVEMEPHGALNYCCGGGGGLASTSTYGERRMAMGKIKAEQIAQTGAKVVATSCFNCMVQIRDLNKAYGLGVEVKSIVELVANSLRLPQG